MSGAGCRCGSDLALLWLWPRPEATTPIQSLAWEPPYATDVVLKRPKKKEKKKREKKERKRKRISRSVRLIKCVLLLKWP